MELKFQVETFSEGFIRIQSPVGALIYMVVGTKSALVIDSGHGLGQLRPVVDAITSLPKTLVLTHGHPDHGGGAAEFEDVWLHPADYYLYKQLCTPEFRWSELEGRLRHDGWETDGLEKQLQPLREHVSFLKDGQTFDLGGRVLEIVHIPGHTMGSVALLDREEELLFAGDMIGDGAILMHPWYCTPLEEFVASMARLEALNTPLKEILPGHPPIPLPPIRIREKRELAERVIAGELSGEPAHHPLGDGCAVRTEHGTLFYDPTHLRHPY